MVTCTLERILFLDFKLGLVVTEINIKNVWKQENRKKNIKNVKRCIGMASPKNANNVGMMHESKDQHIGKAPSLHLFHITVRQHESAPIQ